MIHFKRLVFFILFYATVPAFSQINIQFIPEIFGRSIDGLMNASIYSLKDSRSVKLKIVVSEANVGQVVSIQTQPFHIVPGINPLPATSIKSSRISITNNNVGNYIKQHGTLPIGDYEYSYIVIAASSSEEIIIDQNFSQQIIPPAPFDLIEPFDLEQLCEKRPTFTWQPSIPQVMGSLYQLILVEMKDKQNAVEALNFNLPLINQKGILTNLLMYPPTAKELTVGKKYAWQVTVYKDQSILNRSEVWSFKVDCTDTIANNIVDDNGYRDIEDLTKGNFYMANGVVKFAIINPYEAQDLKYGIICITNPSQKIRGLPKKKLTKGNNKISIALDQNFSFKDGYSYLLNVVLPNGTNRKLRFIYKDPK